MRRIALIGCALLLAMTASASARMGIAPLTAQDDAVIQVKGGHIDTSTSPDAAFIDPLPRCKQHRRRGRSRQQARPVRLLAEAGQPRPISTAIRIKSEWFFAPSFCLSSEVMLATVL
jgi:hypothetical protein